MGEVSGGVLSGRVVDGGSPPLGKRVMALSLLRPSPFSYAHFWYNGVMFGFGALACSLLPDGAMHATYNLGQYTEDGGVLVTARYADGREQVSLSARPVLLDLARAIRTSLTEKAEELQGCSSEGKQGPVSASDEAEEGTPVFPEWLENLHSITVSDYSYSPKDASTVGWVFGETDVYQDMSSTILLPYDQLVKLSRKYNHPLESERSMYLSRTRSSSKHHYYGLSGYQLDEYMLKTPLTPDIAERLHRIPVDLKNLPEVTKLNSVRRIKNPYDTKFSRQRWSDIDLVGFDDGTMLLIQYSDIGYVDDLFVLNEQYAPKLLISQTYQNSDVAEAYYVLNWLQGKSTQGVEVNVDKGGCGLKVDFSIMDFRYAVSDYTGRVGDYPILPPLESQDADKPRTENVCPLPRYELGKTQYDNTLVAAVRRAGLERQILAYNSLKTMSGNAIGDFHRLSA